MALIRFAPCMCALLFLLSACNPPPGVEAGARIAPSDQPVRLLPLDELVAQANGGTANDASAAALAARAARLRGRIGAN